MLSKMYMESSQTLLEGSSDMEKGAYIGAIASLATADRQATPEEMDYLHALCKAAKLSDAQTVAVTQAATQITAEDITRCLDVLKTSDLKYSLITDLIAFAKSDSEYSEQEQQNVKKMADYLGVDQNQFSVLDSFTEKATQSQATQEEMSSPNFLSSLGLKDKLQSAGINGGSLMKGLIGIAGPIILAKMLSGGLNRNRGGGIFGSSGMMGGVGGLDSIIRMLSGGRGMGSLGGLLGGLLRNKRGW